ARGAAGLGADDGCRRRTRGAVVEAVVAEGAQQLGAGGRRAAAPQARSGGLALVAASGAGGASARAASPACPRGARTVGSARTGGVRTAVSARTGGARTVGSARTGGARTGAPMTAIAVQRSGAAARAERDATHHLPRERDV